jgi:hypothetical protein
MLQAVVTAAADQGATVQPRARKSCSSRSRSARYSAAVVNVRDQ